jgi:two-component system chemotaxis response regulator CheY
VKHILIVDDSVTVRMYHRKMLEDAGWEITEAANGVEALEKALALEDEARFELYVVDINMPKMDGYAFVRELRRQPGQHSAPVMMVSTEGRPADAAAAREAGANGYLVKPAKPQDLVLAAALLMGDRRMAIAAAVAATQERKS